MWRGGGNHPDKKKESKRSNMGITNLGRQTVADLIKSEIDKVQGRVGRTRNNRKAKLAIDYLAAFERAPWTPGAFVEATSAAEQTIRVAERGLEFDASAQPIQLYQAVIDLLRRYFANSGFDPGIETTSAAGKLTTKRAAEYVEMSLAAFRKHVYVYKTVHGELFNDNTLMFDVAELDRFQRWYDEQPDAPKPLHR